MVTEESYFWRLRGDESFADKLEGASFFRVGWGHISMQKGRGGGGA